MRQGHTLEQPEGSRHDGTHFRGAGQEQFSRALQAFRDKGGTLRTRDLIALGVHTDALYALRERGRVVELGRGLYRLADVGEAEHPDLAIVAARAPNAAVCLISALSWDAPEGLQPRTHGSRLF